MPQLNFSVKLELSPCFLMLLFITSCDSHLPIAKTNRPPTSGAVQKLDSAGQIQLQGILGTGLDPDLRWPDFTPYKMDLEDFYQGPEPHLAWAKNNQPTSQALTYIKIFQQAGEKGLDPEDYDASRWGARLSALNNNSADGTLVKFDEALTITLMRYARALNVGRLNPNNPGPAINLAGAPFPLAAFLHDKLENAADPATVIKTLEPPWPGYWRMLDALHSVTRMTQQDSGELLPVPRRPLSPGQTYPSIPRLAALLTLIGDLPSGAIVDPQSSLYAGSLVDAVKQYQLRHGLTQDGKLTAAVVNDLNVPLNHRVEQAALALERWRWLPHSFAEPPVIVNVPEFKVRAYDATGHLTLFKSVIVGKAYGHKTPLFENEIKYVVFRPYWEVPPSIQRSEIVPHMQRDHTYFSRIKLEAVAPDGTALTSGSMTPAVLAGLRSGHYHVRQMPGTGNSLGLVKIIFPNSDNIYLHGTDAPHLFSLSRRDLSHGCIRVEDPADLVAWILRNNAGWDIQRVKAAMHGDRDNVRVNLTKTIPVLILYSTVATDEDGHTYFLDDIYGFDATLEAALAKGYPYRTATHITSTVPPR